MQVNVSLLKSLVAVELHVTCTDATTGMVRALDLIFIALETHPAVSPVTTHDTAISFHSIQMDCS